MSDEELMMEVRSGKISALSLLFEKHHARVYDYLYRMTRNRTLSEDLVQDTFEKILKKKHTYQVEYPFAGWLFRIAKNLLMDYYRASKMNVVEVQEFDAAQIPLEPGASQIELALQQLKPEFIEVLTLTKCEGMRYQDVATIVGISETGVKSRVHRAVKALKESYLTINLSP